MAARDPRRLFAALRFRRRPRLRHPARWRPDRNGWLVSLDAVVAGRILGAFRLGLAARSVFGGSPYPDQR